VLISTEPRLLFVHVQKTGGTTIRQLLERHLPGVRPFLGTHDHARWARSALGNAYASYFSFALVRNPWERLVSWYSMIRQLGERVPREACNRLWRYVLDETTSFEEFLTCATWSASETPGTCPPRS
jgi:hypothetical protein